MHDNPVLDALDAFIAALPSQRKNTNPGRGLGEVQKDQDFDNNNREESVSSVSSGIYKTLCARGGAPARATRRFPYRSLSGTGQTGRNGLGVDNKQQFASGFAPAKDDVDLARTVGAGTPRNSSLTANERIDPSGRTLGQDIDNTKNPESGSAPGDDHLDLERVVCAWHLEHGERVPREVCAGCRRPFALGDEILDLADDNRVHFPSGGGGYDCLIRHGNRWRRARAALGRKIEAATDGP